MKNSFDTLSKVKNIIIPTLIIHGNMDYIISFEQGKEIFEKSGSSSKFLITLNNFGHSGIFRVFEEELTLLYKEFLQNGRLDSATISINSKVCK